jgi:S-adenosylmethionine uptake transporter
VRPGAEGFTAYSLLALAAVGFITLRDLATRRLTAATPSLYVTAVTSIGIMLAGGVGAATQGWVAPSAQSLGALTLGSVFLLVGYSFGVMTMRVGEVAVITPFRYSILLWSILLGYLLFGDVPGWLTLLGAVIVAGAGAFTLWREQRARRLARLPSARG